MADKSSGDKRTAAPIIAAVLLMLLPLLYFGSYYALVMPVPVLFFSSSGGQANITFVTAQYRVGGQKTQWFFWPAEQMDRMVRPKTWQSRDALIF